MPSMTPFATATIVAGGAAVEELKHHRDRLPGQRGRDRAGRLSRTRDERARHRRDHSAPFQPGPEDGACPVQASAQRADAAAEFGRRLHVGAPADQAQHHRVAEVVRQPGEFVVQHRGQPARVG